MKQRLDKFLQLNKLVLSRSQAESYIKLGRVTVNGQTETKPGFIVNDKDKVEILSEQYVSRAGLKLASVADRLNLNFRDKIVLDVGSSTGGFTEYALRHGAKKVIAVDVGTGQMHPALIGNPQIELHEKTDIRDFKTYQKIDVILIDVSFISLREILPAVHKLASSETTILAMAKPQFEAGIEVKHKGVIKNDKMRRNTLKELENWVQKLYKILGKADSEVAGSKGNLERFYVLKKLHP